MIIHFSSQIYSLVKQSEIDLAAFPGFALTWLDHDGFWIALARSGDAGEGDEVLEVIESGQGERTTAAQIVVAAAMGTRRLDRESINEAVL